MIPRNGDLYDLYRSIKCGRLIFIFDMDDSYTLDQVYDPIAFRKQGHALIEVLADYFETVQEDREALVIPYVDPEESYKYWTQIWEDGMNHDPTELFKTILDRSAKLHHPRYLGHQVCVTAPVTALASMVSSILNNGMAVYDMGMVSNPMERLISEALAKKIGWQDQEANGLLTSGGSLANLTALLTARAKYSDVWEQGTSTQLAVMVSEEAHYCIDRAVRVMGWGDKGIIKIPTNARHQMDTSLLQAYYDQAQEKGIKVIMIIGCCCSTATGSYDDLQAIGAFAQKQDLWFHVDGAHGAAVLFSDRYRYLTAGIEAADSVVIDWHKMMMTPALATSLVYKRKQDSYHTFHQKAQYLWANPTSQDWFNSGKITFECTKYMMAIKIFTLYKTYGEKIFADYVDIVYDLAKTFATYLLLQQDFEIPVQPESNIVCFRYCTPDEEPLLNALNQTIRQTLRDKGNFYIVQTTIAGKIYLRISIMNPKTKMHDLMDLIHSVRSIATKIE